MSGITIKLLWAQQIGLPECPYMERWVVDFGPFAVRLHHWFGSDDIRAFHDHAWWFLTLVLWGSYTDISPGIEDTLNIFSLRFRHSTHKHTVRVNRKGTWTLMITGKASRRWGFWLDGKLIKRDKWFAEHGHHPCDQIKDQPIRMKPDGARI